MLDKYKYSFFRKLDLDKDTKELIRVYMEIKEQMLKESEGKKNYE